MNPIKLLSKLNISSSDLNFSDCAQVDCIDWRTAAHALSGLSKECTDWALFNFADHQNKRSAVIRALSIYLSMYISINQYKLKPGTLNGLITVALAQVSEPICNKCVGTGWTIVENQQTQCKNCNGKGRKQLSTRSRSKIIGIHHSSYKNAHDDVINEVLRIIGTWNSKIFKNINKKLGLCD